MMKFSINDAYGSSLIGVFRLDGSPAIEGEDFVQWTGKHHKNGRWSYTEGGVALKEGIVVVNRCSTHSSRNHQKYASVIKDNEVIDNSYVCGRLKYTSERPKPSGYWPLDQKAWDACVEAILHAADPELAEETREKWKKIEKFL